MNILHITAHLGGGVGKALSSIVTYEHKNNLKHNHKVLLLDDPEKEQFVNICRNGGVEVVLKNQNYNLNEELTNADIVILHWWHHPIMASFLGNFPQIPLRLVLWSHVNGCNYPCLPYEFVDLPQKTFFTSPFSFENIYWSEKQREKIKKRSTVVYGLGELEFYSKFKKVPSRNFVIGYVGTLSISKLHPQFVDFCYAVLKKVPDAYFVMVGDLNNSNAILQKARSYHIEDRFKFTGYSTQIVDELSQFDIFAYPLNPKHFGTTENVLLEAMAFGLPVVALNHNTEKYIIKDHRKVGFLADNMEHYANSIKYLYEHPVERTRIGRNAREYVRKNFTFKKNVELMRGELNKVFGMPKKHFNFKDIFGKQPYEWFLACLGEDQATFSDSIDRNKRSNTTERKIVENKIKASSPILREKTKSSIAHFAVTFPEDKNLQYWKSLLDEQEVLY